MKLLLPFTSHLITEKLIQIWSGFSLSRQSFQWTKRFVPSCLHAIFDECKFWWNLAGPTTSCSYSTHHLLNKCKWAETCAVPSAVCGVSPLGSGAIVLLINRLDFSSFQTSQPQSQFPVHCFFWMLFRSLFLSRQLTFRELFYSLELCARRKGIDISTCQKSCGSSHAASHFMDHYVN